MNELLIKDYEESMLDEMISMFYDTVHTVNAKDYNKEQLDGWAPQKSDRISWVQRLNNNVCKVAFINNVLIGFAEVTAEGHIDTMYVHKDFQRRKIAAGLIEALMEVTSKRNYEVLTTEASITAKPFFEKFGFEVTRRKKKLYNGRAFVNYKMTKYL